MAMKRKRKKRNRYVWRQDFALLKEHNDTGEIGRAVRKHRILWKTTLLIGVIGWWLFVLAVPVLLLCRAELIYTELCGMAALVMSLMYGKILTIPKITKRDIENMENELSVQSDRVEHLDAIFTEQALIVQQGLLVFRIPYHEIVKIRVRIRANRTGGTSVRYRLRDGTNIETRYYGLGMYLPAGSPYVVLWERVRQVNPEISIDYR